MTVTKKIEGGETTEERSQELGTLMPSDSANVSSMSIESPYSFPPLSLITYNVDKTYSSLMEFAEETVMTGAPARQNARQDVIDPDSYKSGLASLSTSNVARNSSISAIRGSASKDGSLLTGLKELLNLPKDYIDEFERVISMILDQETVTVDKLIHTMAAKLSSTEKLDSSIYFMK